MTIRKTILVLTLAAGSLHATQAGAFFYLEEDRRPPPNGANGTSLNGLTEPGLISGRDASETVALKTIVLPDGSRITVQ